MRNITIYTDGACSGNPGVGGWSAILLYNNHTKRISCAERNTTNNRMELQAVIAGLSCVKQPSNISVYSDSAYVVNAFSQKWIESWLANGWRTSGNKPVQNKDLWVQLLALTKIHHVKFIKVKGHANNKYNEECDKLARAAIYNFI